MKISSQISDKFSIIKFEADQVLGYEAQEFQDAILDSLDKNANCIIVDLSSVKFISSWGIGILIHGYTTATNEGISFKLACVPENIKQTFVKIKIDTIFEQFKTVDEALKS